jgi:hypothetical protein
MIAEALVECRLIVLKDLIDAQLMDHDGFLLLAKRRETSIPKPNVRHEP